MHSSWHSSQKSSDDLSSSKESELYDNLSELAEDDEVDGAGGLEMDIRHLDFELSYKGAFNTRFNLHMLSLVNTGPCA